MPKLRKFIFSAIAATLGIYVVANMTTAYVEMRKDFFQTSIQSIQDLDLDVTQVLLHASSNDFTGIEYGSLARVMEFSIDANNPYSLRYVTVKIDSSGLSEIKNWKVYKMDGRNVDYLTQLGKVIDSKDGFLRIKMYREDNESAPYLGEEGETKFMLTAEVYDDGIKNENKLEAYFPSKDLVSGNFDWAWLPGIYTKSWGTSNESYGLSLINLN